MERDSRNIYRNARVASGLTQERWAEMLGLSAEAVRQYEAGKILPSDDVVASMAETAVMPILCYWHLVHKSRVAGRILPPLKVRTLPEAVLNLLVRVEAFSRGGLEDLKKLAADGKISASEVMSFGDALSELRELIAAAYELEYAQEVNDGDG